MMVLVPHLRRSHIFSVAAVLASVCTTIVHTFVTFLHPMELPPAKWGRGRKCRNDGHLSCTLPLLVPCLWDCYLANEGRTRTSFHGRLTTGSTFDESATPAMRKG
jgi:hypothetical protein